MNCRHESDSAVPSNATDDSTTSDGQMPRSDWIKIAMVGAVTVGKGATYMRVIIGGWSIAMKPADIQQVVASGIVILDVHLWTACAISDLTAGNQ